MVIDFFIPENIDIQPCLINDSLKRVQVKNKQFIEGDRNFQHLLNDIRHFCDKKDKYNLMCSAFFMLERLTGYESLTSTVIGKLDLPF